MTDEKLPVVRIFKVTIIKILGSYKKISISLIIMLLIMSIANSRYGFVDDLYVSEWDGAFSGLLISFMFFYFMYVWFLFFMPECFGRGKGFYKFFRSVAGCFWSFSLFFIGFGCVVIFPFILFGFVASYFFAGYSTLIVDLFSLSLFLIIYSIVSRCSIIFPAAISGCADRKLMWALSATKYNSFRMMLLNLPIFIFFMAIIWSDVLFAYFSILYYPLIIVLGAFSLAFEIGVTSLSFKFFMEKQA